MNFKLLTNSIDFKPLWWDGERAIKKLKVSQFFRAEGQPGRAMLLFFLLPSLLLFLHATARPPQVRLPAYLIFFILVDHRIVQACKSTPKSA